MTVFYIVSFIVALIPTLWEGRLGRIANGALASPEGFCPKPCFCNSVNMIVFCSRRGLSHIPDGVPAATLNLNLNGNNFRSSVVQRSNFSRYVDLEHLYMSDCGLELIDVDSFADLTRLQWLDLSDNRLSVVKEATFRGLNLQHLFLNGNRGLQLLPFSFEGLVTTGLYLHDCSIMHLSTDVLAPLNGTLTNLWLNSNHIERIDRSLVGLFSQLTHIRLSGNPLRCNCEVVWLKEFFDENEEMFKGADSPSCGAPTRLSGRRFGELSGLDFRCQTPAFNNIDALFDTARGRLKCSATGDPLPVLYWIQPSGKTIRYNPYSSSSVPSLFLQDKDRRVEATLVLDNLGVWQGDGGAGLSGMYICVANNEAGNVTLTINVTWPRVKPTAHHRVHPLGTHDTNHTHAGLLVPPATAKITTSGSGRYILIGGNISGDDLLKDKQDEFDVALDGEDASSEGRFTLTELTAAIVGTHLATVLVCLICLPVCHWRFVRQVKHRSYDDSYQQQHLQLQDELQQRQLLVQKELNQQLLIQQQQQEEQQIKQQTLFRTLHTNYSHRSGSYVNHYPTDLYCDPNVSTLTNR